MLPGVPVHIVHRGNNKQSCFREDQDRAFYLLHFTKLLRQTECAMHCYCLMTNHVHFLVTARTPDGCARLMKGVAQLHTQYINRTYGRSGSLWEGRFRSCLVQTEDYVLACYRYIELNPVRAALCQHPREYRWSSYRANAEGAFDALITPHDEYHRLAVDAISQRAAYRAMFESRLSEHRLAEIRKATNGNFALGDRTFRDRIQGELGRRVSPGRPGRPPTTPTASETAQLELLEPGKNVVCP